MILMASMSFSLRKKYHWKKTSKKLEPGIKITTLSAFLKSFLQNSQHNFTAGNENNKKFFDSVQIEFIQIAAYSLNGQR